MPVIVQSGNGRTVVVDAAHTAAIVENRPVTTQVNDQRTAQGVVARSNAVAVASPGVQGAPGPSGSDALLQIASEVLGGHRVVRSTGSGSVGYADSHNASHGDDTVGVTLNAAALGDQVSIVTGGPVSFNGWAWAPLQPVFATTNGLLTQTPPSELNGDAFSQVIGHAQDATTLFVQIEPPTYL